ncbi:hypothetical protein [Parasitella parasitica]|uniref:C2H2-type domain-containing protein n=1 Tax=Parasitella parasitica TaxID=35722 RepID=A0A0B7N7G9_9FUNG|nr:hypothetical protein [Parasitella parasitica]
MLPITYTGENILKRKEGGFPCPACQKYLKNGATLKIHLKKHQLSCDFIFESTVEIPKELAVHDTPVSVALKSPCVQDVPKSSAAINSHFSANTSNSSADVFPLNVEVCSTDNSVLELDFAVPIEHERLIFENIDVTSRFRDFQLQVKRRLNENKHLTLEENVQHILALSSILLLKPGRTHTDIHEHITFNQCENLLIHILNSNGITGQMFPSATKEKLEEIVHNLIENVSNDFISQALPRFVIEDGPQETELITRYLQAALVPLFENIDEHILFRWTSISDNEKVIMLRPDASINTVHGAALDQRLGCGEVKSQYQALNHRLTGLDLVRVAHLAKTASDKYKAIATFAFMVVGNHATFYVLHRTKANMYTMSEVEHIQLALKLTDIPLFIAQSSKIAKIISSFEHVLNCGNHDYDDHPPTLTDHMLFEAIHSKTSRKRKSISSHYNH